MPAHRSYPKKAGFRLGIYVCKDAEIVDFAAPQGVFSVARRCRVLGRLPPPLEGRVGEGGTAIPGT